MSGTQVQAGSPNTDFLKGLDLIIDSLVDKNSPEDDYSRVNSFGSVIILVQITLFSVSIVSVRERQIQVFHEYSQRECQ